jgi:Cdc6-like AAA superfamily ATPase
MVRQIQQTVDNHFQSGKRQRVSHQTLKRDRGIEETSGQKDGFREEKDHVFPAIPSDTAKCRELSDKRKETLPSEPSTAPVGRSHEFRRIYGELYSLCTTGTSRSLFIAGLPGSGKTFVVERALEAISRQVQAAHINMAGMLQTDTLFQALDESLGGRCGRRCPATHARKKRLQNAAEDLPTNHTQMIDALLKSRLRTSRRPLCLVFDEIDLWLAHRQRRALAYALFTIPLRFPKQCCVIGIANAVDFTERALPALRSLGSTPMVLVFAPYTSRDLVEIARERLQTEGSAWRHAQTSVQESALELAARKVAAAHQGDVRAMLSACRKAFENDFEPASEPSEPTALHTVATRLTNRVHLSSPLETIRSLPIQQQMVLWVLAQCAYPLSVTLREVFLHVRKLFGKLRLDAIDLSTLHEICSTSLRHQGIVEYKLTSTRGARQSRSIQTAQVRLQIPPVDVHDALRDIPSLHALLGCVLTNANQ